MDILETPFAVFIIAAAAQWLAAYAGDFVRNRGAAFDADDREDFNLVRNAALTLLALIIGFSFSMAVSRYDQRKNYEEAEANAIGTEYVRADLLPPADADRVHQLLRAYLDQRILFYRAPLERDVPKINADTAKLQDDLWAAVRGPASAQPNPINALVVAGMNDVLNSQGYTQAAWWNRIPVAAWLMMFAIAVCANIMIGFGARTRHSALFLILPLVAAISFFLIADIDSPRGGAIRVRPQNLHSLADSLKPH
jgi:hypothetical protein